MTPFETCTQEYSEATMRHYFLQGNGFADHFCWIFSHSVKEELEKACRKSVPCGDSAPAFRWWRVVNAERLGDHWNIGELEMFEPSGVGTEVDCERACADMHHCCSNIDVSRGCCQRLSCLQACKVRERGKDKNTCRSYCSMDGCYHIINGYEYFLCGECADVPHHGGSNLYPNGQCSTQYGSDPQTCLDGCSMDVRLADKIISDVSSYNYGQHQDLVGSYQINHTNR